MSVLTKIHKPVFDQWFSIDSTEAQLRHDIIFIKFYAVYYLEKMLQYLIYFLLKWNRKLSPFPNTKPSEDSDFLGDT